MNTHLEVRKPAFSRFLKAEAAEFAKKTIGIVRSKEAEDLLITPFTAPLLALKPEIELLSLRYGVDPERIKVETLKSKMMLTISDLKLQVRLRSKDANDADLYLIGSHINTHLRSLNKARNDKVLAQKIDGFSQAVQTDAALSEALVEHDLTSYVTTIKLALAEFRAAMSDRVTLLSERPKVDTQLIVAKVAKTVNNLFNGIEASQIINPEVDYEPLIHELNELVNGFRLSVRLRIANNKRKAEGKEEEEEDQEQPNDPTPDPEDDEGTTEVQATSARSYGFAPYNLSVEPEEDEEDYWDEEDDDESEEGDEYAEEPAEGGEED
ncbi:MAG: hypothetical protein GX921_09300 [Bacteroidales bacterium]|nr:hypothetical protein [Bacteroidales bacterium]